MTQPTRDDLRLAVLLLSFLSETTDTVIALLHGDDALSRARRDIEDAREREQRALDAEIFLEQQAAKGPTE